MKSLPYGRFLAMVLLAFAPFARPSAAAELPPAVEATDAVRNEVPWLLIDDKDLAISTPTFLRHTVGIVETFFSTPLAYPINASQWADTVEPSDDFGTLFVLSDNLLGKTIAVDPGTLTWEPPEPVPPSARTAIKHLVAAISAAQPYLNKAVASVRSDERAKFAEMFEWPIGGTPISDDISTRRIRRSFETMKSYDDGSMRTAGGLVLMAVDEAVLSLRDTIYYVPQPVRFESPVGDIVIGGNGPDIYTKRDIENAVVIVDFGGRNTYVGPVAFAKPGETRVVIDLGGTIDIRADARTPGAAGASLFGIGVMAMPNDLGVKTISAGPWSLGASLGGIGACLTAGTVRAETGRFSQGAGIYGVGYFTPSLATSSSYTATAYAQGVGGPRGIGIFRHQGDDAILLGGLSDPDPRESGGASSLCQGVGFGRRAYSGGGIGICTLKGDRISALSSYFAQGAGYWHAAGVFRLRGNGGMIQGRRYALGTGVHSAFGHFEALGNGTRILNWGVGPAYGWDRGVGSAIVIGNAVSVQGEWGIGTAEVGGRGFGYYRVNNGKFKVPHIGNGGFLRNEPAYSVQIVTGTGNQIEGFGALGDVGSGRSMENQWGLFRASGVAFEQEVFLTPPIWPQIDREVVAAAQTADLRAELVKTQGAGSRESISALADIAAAFALDKETPREALRRLFSLPADEAKFLVDAYEPSAVEQSIFLGIAIGARGAALTKNLFSVKDPLKIVHMTHLIRLSRPSVSISYLKNRTDAKDPAVVSAALRALGFVMNTDNGAEPGERTVLDAVQRALDVQPGRAPSSEKALALLSRVRFPEAIAFLATCASIGPNERIELLSAGPEDVTDKLGSVGAGKFMDIVGRDAKGNRERILKEITTIDKARASIRKLLEKKSKSRDAMVLRGALNAAGQVGVAAAKDASWVEKFLTHDRGDLREAAAVALGRLGDNGLPALRRASRSSSARTRALAVYGAGFGTTSAAADIVAAGLADNSPLVVMMAAAVVRNPSEALKSELSALKKKAALRLSETTNRDLKLQLRQTK